MCRSKDQGGRRCDGRRVDVQTSPGGPPQFSFDSLTTTGPTIFGDGVVITDRDEVADTGGGFLERLVESQDSGGDFLERMTASAAAVPDRERTDQLAAAMPTDATGWDGKPLDDKGRRLYALRDSGYTGPIDQDGYPQTTGEAADILRRIAQNRGESPSW